MTAARKIELLVIDDDRTLAQTLRTFLSGEGYAVEIAHTPEAAREALEQNPGLAAALVDLVMPKMDGLAVMEMLHERSPRLPVVIMTGFGTIETAVEAMKRGAEDYITKPFDKEAVRKKIGRLMELHRLRQRVARLEDDLTRARNPFGTIVHISDSMRKIVEQARTVAATSAPVLILGETGTGKEILARAIHDASPRGAAPFMALNCGALPDGLIESELFGVRKGAFTGAMADAPGLFLAANHGTVFLDEIGEMPREAQVKLLRVLQERELRPVGATRSVSVDVRIISATNCHVADLQGAKMRQDLYFRLASVVLEIPPLRDRKEDIAVLAHHFAAQLSESFQRRISITPEAIVEMQLWEWPGNVRELEHDIQGAAALSADDPQVIGPEPFRRKRQMQARLRDVPFYPNLPLDPPRRFEPQISPEPLSGVLGPASGVPLPPGAASLNSEVYLPSLERQAILRALQVCGNNRSKAAQMLGISRDTLYRKLREFFGDIHDIHASEEKP